MAGGLLDDVTWAVAPGEHWAVLGRNGAGKSTLLAAVLGRRELTAGRVSVLGHAVGSPRMRDPRRVVGTIEDRAFAAAMRPADVVVHGVAGSVAAQGRRPTDEARERADALLRRLGCAHLLDRPFSTCSRGERQRVLIARALARRPAVLLMDEPAVGLDLPGREELLHAVAALADEQPGLATVTVTHHVEELATSTSHALLLAEGRVEAQGPVGATLTGEALSACFGMALDVARDGGRWTAKQSAAPVAS